MVEHPFGNVESSPGKGGKALLPGVLLSLTHDPSYADEMFLPYRGIMSRVTQRLQTVILTAESRPEQFLPLKQPHPRAVWF